MRLPAADEVEFHVRQRRDIHAEYVFVGDAHSITVSSKLIGSFDELCKVVAHEMIHLKQLQDQGYRKRRPTHGPSFKTLAKQVCRYHGFDPKLFV